MGRRVADMTVTEYRINKKGCECFRSKDWEEIEAKLAELKTKKPNCKFTTQHRSVRKNKFGCYDTDWMGRIDWTPWLD